MNLSDRRNYELHRLVAIKIKQDPNLLAIALRNLDRYEEINGRHRYYGRWREIIGQGPGNVIQMLLDTSDEAQTLRSATPFSGVLTNEERLRIIREVGAGRI